MKIGIVGLGIMGSGMATNFIKNGYELFVWNRSPQVAIKLSKQGATLCGSPAQVCKKSDIVFEVTANDESSKAVWLGKDGILSTADKSKTLITSATLSVEWVDELAEKCQTSGFTFFDMPLTGGRKGAESGNLTMLVGGDEAKLEELKPLFEAVAGSVFRLGEAGHGTRYKLILNTLFAIHIAGFGEVMKLAEGNGMDIKKVGDALVHRPGGTITTAANERFHNQPDPITFSVKWITKDLKYAKQFADNMSTPLLDSVLSSYNKILEEGRGEKDWTNLNEDR